jgi:hypothetical protein
LACKGVLRAIRGFLYELDGFDAQFRDLVEQTHRERVGESAEAWRILDVEQTKLAAEIANLMEAIKQFGPTPEIKAAHDNLSQRKQQNARERRALENVTKRELQLPGNIAELRDALEAGGRFSLYFG